MTSKNKLFGRVSYRQLILVIWVAVIIGLLSLFGIFIYVAKTKMPDTAALENPTFEESTIVFSDDLVEIDRYFQRNRQWVKHQDINQHIIDALLATEDIRFFDHSGIDARGTGRAFVFLGSRGGASTITQQLAKQFFTEKRSRVFIKRVWQKMKEWVIAVEFERRYTKQEILAMFLNKFEYTYQAYGLGSAANIYFGKDQKDLTVPESAVLVGMLNNPIIYNPVTSPEGALRRRNLVLAQMNKYGFITQEEYIQFKNEEIDISKFSRGENYNGPAPHFMSELKQELKALLLKHNITKPGGEKFNLDTDGLEIYTTIDSKHQAHAEAAALNHMKRLQKRFEAVWKDKDPWTYIDDDDLSESEQSNQIKKRDRKLNELIESSERYKRLRHHYLNDITAAIIADVPDARLWNGDINRLLKAESNPSYLDDLIASNYIRQDQKENYLLILKNPNWLHLKTEWYELKNEVIRVFNQRNLMSVYSYNGPIEMLMSPLDSIKYMANFLQIGSISIDPKTGYIKSWVGGTDYDLWKYDHVTSNRQVGSTFKPFLYTAAIDNGISPCLKVRDMQYVIPANEPPFGLLKSWEPKNTRGEFSDKEVTLKEGLRQSLNSVSVSLVKDLGTVAPVVSLAESMGITKGKIEPYPAIVLGAPTLSVFEMTSAYSTFANNGVSAKPTFIKKIIHDGVVIFEEEPQSRRTIREDVNYAMVQLLKHASSIVSYQLKSEFGGKTGTTNDHVDGWYMGITPSLVTGTWVGGEYNWIRFLTIEDGQGGRMARPFFIDYMKRLEEDEEISMDVDATFVVPQGNTIEVNCEAYDQLESNTLSDPFDDLEIDTLLN